MTGPQLFVMLPVEVVDMTKTGTSRTTGPKASDGPAGDSEDNQVSLRGRVSTGPTDRELPSGTVITSVRISVRRARTSMTAGSTQTSDWVDCTAWAGRTRRSLRGWQVGDEVEVVGSLRRRFYRAGEGSSTRLEVEVLTARRARRRDGGSAE